MMDLFFVAQPKSAILLLSGLPLRSDLTASSNTAYLGVARREIRREVSICAFANRRASREYSHLRVGSWNHWLTSLLAS